MKFNSDEITKVIREEIANFRSALDVAHVGRVLDVGDGIARIYGLSEAMAGEMLLFEGGTVGQVFNLEDTSVGAVVYGPCEQIKEGQSVRGTGKLLEVPVGDAILGRVIDPLGRPLDGQGPVRTDAFRPLETAAPGLAQRQPVDEPLMTGIKAIDSMTPIGRGQRQLIIGDRRTGKTAIAVDAIINQRDTGVLCIYVAVGQKESTVAGVVETLREHDAMKHTVVVAASSSDPAPLQYVAPYAGCAMAEHFMDSGRAVLVIYDDLSKQAAAYRQISLLLRRPPGREAYPGDVFYLHSRLLERACKLAERFIIVPANTPVDSDIASGIDGKVYVGPPGRTQAQAELAKKPQGAYRVHRLRGSGGSMTALPICETQEGEVAAYIPTNLISITDGQIYLEPSLFLAGVRPPINAGISVSRVGFKAASAAMKEVAKSLRIDLAAYRELEAFARLGMELDPAAQGRLDRGARIVQLLVQGQYVPMATVDQVIAIFAGVSGALDTIAVDAVGEYERGLLEYIQKEHRGLRDEIASDLKLPAQRRSRLEAALQAYDELFHQHAAAAPAGEKT